MSAPIASTGWNPPCLNALNLNINLDAPDATQKPLVSINVKRGL